MHAWLYDSNEPTEQIGCGTCRGFKRQAFSVHLSPGSSSFLPKYDINNNYSKLV